MEVLSWDQGWDLRKTAGARLGAAAKPVAVVASDFSRVFGYFSRYLSFMNGSKHQNQAFHVHTS